MDINYISVKDKEIEYIAEALKVNSSITQLDISNRGVGAEGSKYVAKALKYNSTLSTLYFMTEIGNDPSKYYLKALQFNSSLTDLHLDPIAFHTARQEKTKLQQVLKKNLNIQSFATQKLPLPKEIKESIKEISLIFKLFSIPRELISHFLKMYFLIDKLVLLKTETSGE
uniref:Uncharacterized protein n=1 Tax=Arcella intermedia TaxID=1963864 RepID=A0A6B2LM41_9EUKA